jgi:hypothetical protein
LVIFGLGGKRYPNSTRCAAAQIAFERVRLKIFCSLPKTAKGFHWRNFRRRGVRSMASGPGGTLTVK